MEVFTKKEELKCIQMGFQRSLLRVLPEHKLTKALEVYEQPTVEQKMAVSKVLTLGGVHAPQPTKPQTGMLQNTAPQQLNLLQAALQTSENLMGTMFSNPSGCTINITPQHFVVNLQPNVKSH